MKEEEKNKYYTPSIEEFYAGFECELKVGGWEDGKLTTCFKRAIIDDFAENMTKDPIKLAYVSAASYLNLMEDSYEKEEFIRVKYLNKEDVKSLGFVKTKDTGYHYQFQKTIGDYDDFIEINIEGKETIVSKEICCEMGHSSYTIFEGIIKNKSELIKLLSQLGIKL